MINNYPEGAQKDTNAPYNQVYKEVDVELVLAKSTTFKIPADIYDDEEAIKEEILKQVNIPKGYEVEDIIIW